MLSSPHHDHSVFRADFIGRPRSPVFLPASFIISHIFLSHRDLNTVTAAIFQLEVLGTAIANPMPPKPFCLQIDSYGMGWLLARIGCQPRGSQRDNWLRAPQRFAARICYSCRCHALPLFILGEAPGEEVSQLLDLIVVELHVWIVALLSCQVTSGIYSSAVKMIRLVIRSLGIPDPHSSFAAAFDPTERPATA